LRLGSEMLYIPGPFVSYCFYRIKSVDEQALPCSNPRIAISLVSWYPVLADLS
jgi:hypothetical protein